MNHKHDKPTFFYTHNSKPCSKCGDNSAPKIGRYRSDRKNNPYISKYCKLCFLEDRRTYQNAKWEKRKDKWSKWRKDNYNRLKNKVNEARRNRYKKSTYSNYYTILS